MKKKNTRKPPVAQGLTINGHPRITPSPCNFFTREKNFLVDSPKTEGKPLKLKDFLLNRLAKISRSTVVKYRLSRMLQPPIVVNELSCFDSCDPKYEFKKRKY
jgi:hypothetical protein